MTSRERDAALGKNPDIPVGAPAPKSIVAVHLAADAIRRLVDANIIGLVVGSATGRILDANDYYLRLTGHTRAELERGMIDWRAMTPPEWLWTDEWATKELRDRGASTPYEKEYVRADGSRVPVLVADAMLPGPEGEIAAFVLDLSDRKRVEETSRLHEERYRSLFENMLNGFAYCRMLYERDEPHDFVYLAVNQAFGRLTGLKNVVGRKVSEVIPEIRNSDPELLTIYGRVARTGRPESFETYVEGLGNWFFISVYSPAKDHFVAVFDVITARKQAEERLRLFRALIERSSDAIEVVDPATGRFLDVNETSCRMLGYTRDELLARTIFEIDRGIDPAQFAAVGERLKTEEKVTFEIRRWRKDGTSLLVEISVSPVALDRAYLVAIVRDITGRKQAETELRLQAAALNAAANAIAITDPEGTIQWANAAFSTISGYSATESIGRKPRDLVKSGSHDREFYRLMWDTILAGKVWHGEVVNRRKDGSLYTEEMTITPVRDERGAISNFIAVKQDISERKRVEARLTEQAALLDRASDAIYVTALDCSILYWNPAAERIYGWTAAEIMGEKTSELLAADGAAIRDLVVEVVEKGDWFGERRQQKKSGQPVDVSSRLTLLRDARGQPHSILVINTDITEKKQLEAQFLRAQRLESIGALASGMAHDLNNVLAPIMMGVPLLRATAQDATAEKLLTLMEASARRGADIVRQVLTFARGTQGERVPVQLTHLVREMVRMAEQTFPKNVAVDSVAGAEVWPVDCDVTQVHQALMNLCVNARDAMPEGGELSLTVENVTIDSETAARTPGVSAGPYVRLAVADTGTGIPPEVQDRIFEPFYTTKGVGKGTGLGLSTVLGIIKGHEGFIRVDSQVGRGTTFELFFPAALAPRSTRAPVPAVTFPWPRAEGELVLVVDDEAAVREVARQALEEFGFRVMVCGAGAEALQIFQTARSEVQLVVTDMMMPEMDGPSLVRALRSIEPGVPIVGITGVLDQPTIVRLEALSLPAMLTKPFTVGELLTAVRGALPPKAGAPKSAAARA